MAFYWTAKGNFYAKLWTSPAPPVNGTTDSRGSVTTVCLSAGLILQTRTMCAKNGRRENELRYFAMRPRNARTAQSG